MGEQTLVNSSFDRRKSLENGKQISNFYDLSDKRVEISLLLGPIQ
jgi:hypothetical protein